MQEAYHDDLYTTAITFTITNCSVESFKTELDKYLGNVPDTPQIPDYTAMRRADSNSCLVDLLNIITWVSM